MIEIENTKENLSGREILLNSIKTFQAEIRDKIREQTFKESKEELSKVIKEGEGDVSFQIDISAEDSIEKFAQSLSKKYPLRIIAEGWGKRNFPQNSEPQLEIIIDPIDGTRGIMYDLREAWILTGVSSYNKGKNTLANIDLAVQTEIPTTDKDRAKVIWAIKGQGTIEETWDLKENKLISKKKLFSSQAKDINNGFGIIVDFFPGAKEETGKLSDKIFEKVLEPAKKNGARAFNDQYICNGGQIACLAQGKYRFIADLRPEMEKVLSKKGRSVGLAAHPYDLSTILIAQEAGAIITNTEGKEISYPLDTQTNCGWIGYANKDIRKLVEPVLLEELNLLTKIN